MAFINVMDSSAIGDNVALELPLIAELILKQKLTCAGRFAVVVSRNRSWGMILAVLPTGRGSPFGSPDWSGETGRPSGLAIPASRPAPFRGHDGVEEGDGFRGEAFDIEREVGWAGLRSPPSARGKAGLMVLRPAV